VFAKVFGDFLAKCYYLNPKTCGNLLGWHFQASRVILTTGNAIAHP